MKMVNGRKHFTILESLGIVFGGLIGSFVLLIILALLFGSSDSSTINNKSTSTKEVIAEEPVIEYRDRTAMMLFDEFNENALRTKEDYKGSYLKISGYVNIIDEDGKYFTLDDGDSWSFDDIKCTFSSEDQKEFFINNCATDDYITVFVKVTNVSDEWFGTRFYTTIQHF